MNLKGTKKKNQVVITNIFEEQELLKKAEVIRKNLTASTWHELETNGKFDKNAKLSFISDDMLILGCDIPYAKNILEISGIGENTLTGILAEMGDVSRFSNAKEIQKLSGLSLVACSSGKHKGETKISHRGRKRLRYWLFQAAKSTVAHAEEYKELHVYYATRAENPLKKKQSLIVIACKLLRIIFVILTKGIVYDPQKMLKDIRRLEK